MTLHHRFDGDDGAPVVVLSGSLGSTLAMWEPQLPALTERFRVLRYDHPGHGESPVGEERTVSDLAAGVLALLDELGVERASWCGLSLGGMLGMRLALDAPERLHRLVLCCTSPHMPPPEAWDERAEAVRTAGIEAIADTVVGRWFTDAFPDVRRYREMLVSTDAEGYARCCEAIRDWDVRDELERVRTPTLVIGAADDPSTPPAEHAEPIARTIPEARLEIVPNARHLVNVERPDELNRLLLEHL
jgi:3-oxoadipate enol-lactonase